MFHVFGDDDGMNVPDMPVPDIRRALLAGDAANDRSRYVL